LEAVNKNGEWRGLVGRAHGMGRSQASPWPMASSIPMHDIPRLAAAF